MSDNKRTLPESLGMPMCWIYTANKDPILLRGNYGEQTNINQFITKFSYKYDEENDDECIIKIAVASTSQLNNPQIVADSKLLVEWGYILPGGKLLKSHIRKVAIRDLNANYKSDGIELEIVCTDLLSYLKSQRMNSVTTADNYEAFIKEVIGDKYVATRTIKGKVRFLNDTETLEGNNPNWSKKSWIKENKAVNENFAYTDDMRYTDKLGLFMVKDQDVVIKGSGKSITQEIKRLLNEQPGEPAYLEGRDDRLNVLNRNWGQAPSAVYTFNGAFGEIIDFNPKSNIQKVDDDEIEGTHVDPETKQVETTKMATTEADYGELPEGVTRLDAKKVELVTKMAYDISINNQLNQVDINKNIIIKRKIELDGRGSMANKMGTTSINLGKRRQEEFISVPTKSILNSPYLKKERRDAIMANFVKKKMEKKFEATGKIIGDPSLICSKVHLIKGLAEVDNGNWYVASVTHEIEVGSGYICNVNYLKKPKTIRTFYEARKYPEGEQSTTPPEQSSEALVYEDIKELPNSGFNSNDIQGRIDAQYLYEKQYLKGNDIAFQSKEDINLFSIEPNSMNT